MMTFYAEYLGKTRLFPHGEAVKSDVVYEIAVVPPGPGYKCFLVQVETLCGSVYVPYADAEDIWEEWTPYTGEVI